MFQKEQSYSKQRIYEILQVPTEKQRGNWDTGYTKYNGEFFIFANIDSEGRTGHDYENYWDENLFHWEGKTGSKITQALMQELLSTEPRPTVYLFTRTNNRDPFLFEGKMSVWDYEDVTPVKVKWRPIDAEYPDEEDVDNGIQILEEGRYVPYSGKRYERNPQARRMCIKKHGTICKGCNIDLEVIYGEIAKGFIHVHHILPISVIGKKYEVDPEKDLVPLCPNCHSIVHRRKPCLSIVELKDVLQLVR